MANRPQPVTNSGPLGGATLAERIDEAAKRAGKTTTALAKAAGVTFAAAARWRKGQARPRLEHLRAIARECGVTLDELVGEDGYEPDYAAWTEFLETPTGQTLTASERRWLATQWFPDDAEPTVATYLVMVEARRTMRRV